MATINVQIKGIKETLKKFEKFGEEGVKEVQEVTRFVADDIVADAKRLSPVDTGRLRQSISRQEVNKLTQRIVSSEKYAPYMEFGTGRLTSIPTELKELASLFKGKGVKEINIPAQPFMYPAFILGRQEYLEELKDSLKYLTGKFGK